MEGITSSTASKQSLEYGSNIQILRSQGRKSYGWRYAAAEQPTYNSMLHGLLLHTSIHVMAAHVSF